MNNRFNKLLDEIFIQINQMLIFGPIFLERTVKEILGLNTNILISKNSINLNTTKYPIFKISQKEINFYNIKAIILDYVRNARLNSEIYIHIFNEKGQLLSDFSLTINEKFLNNPNIYIVYITNIISSYCREYMRNIEP
jgi:hypothetical protein